MAIPDDWLTDEQIKSKFAEVLSSWPLYRRFRYHGNPLTKERGGSTPLGGGSVSVVYLPDFDLFCPTCKREQRWTCSDPKIHYFGAESYCQKTYICRNCGNAKVTYFIRWRQDETEGSFVKVGQEPALTAVPPPELKLGPDDLALYKKALTSRNNSFGIGALAYIRRVVENRMNGLLDLVVEAANQAGSMTPEKIASLDGTRENGRFEDKAKFAGAILPNHLKPGGHNPFDVLCKFASEGIHDQSDEECIEVFDEVRLVFEYLFRHLTVQSEDRKLFVEGLGRLAGRKPGRQVQ